MSSPFTQRQARCHHGASDWRTCLHCLRSAHADQVKEEVLVEREACAQLAHETAESAAAVGADSAYQEGVVAGAMRVESAIRKRAASTHTGGKNAE